MLAQIIEAIGYAQAHNSILLINVMIRRAVEFEQKASEYEELRFYPVGHPRKLLIEERNECFNEVLVELKKWHDGNGNILFSLPLPLRPYQEDASRIKLICKDFLQLEMSGEIESALKKVI